MPFLQCSTVCHELHEDFEVHPNSPWKALQSLYAPPYLLTIDNFGGANNVWCIESEGSEPLRRIMNLHPPLAASLRQRRVIVAYKIRLLLVEFDDPRGRRNENGVLRAYALDSGRMIQEVELPGGLAQAPSRHSGNFLAVAVIDGERRPKIIIYALSLSGLQEVRRIGVDPLIQTSGEENLVPLHLTLEGYLLTSSTFIPSRTLAMKFHELSSSYQQTLPAFNSSSDYLEPTAVVVASPSYVTVVVEETSSHNDFHPFSATSTVHNVTLPRLSRLWQRPLPHKITSLSHHRALNVFVALGTIHKDENNVIFSIAFLDDQSGEVLKEETFPYPSDGEGFTATCTSCDDFVVIFNTGRLLILPIKNILDSGLVRDERGRVITQKIPVRPDPINAKARKAGDRWEWIDHAIVGSKELVLIPVRGPEMYVVSWRSEDEHKR